MMQSNLQTIPSSFVHSEKEGEVLFQDKDRLESVLGVHSLFERVARISDEEKGAKPEPNPQHQQFFQTVANFDAFVS